MIRIDYVLLARAAEVRGGLLYIEGGDLHRLGAAAFPHEADLAVALRVRAPWGDGPYTARLRVDLIDADGNQIADSPAALVVIAPGQPEGVDGQSPLCLTFRQVAFEHPGTYAVVIFVDGAERARAELLVAGVGGA